MNSRIEASSSHAVQVQNVRFASLSKLVLRFPRARLPCRADTSAKKRNPGK
jgi:hypothetical protein